MQGGVGGGGGMRKVVGGGVGVGGRGHTARHVAGETGQLSLIND